mmetsp:Transcript_5392/g.20252  ORF Transcript_5392/g.20252 Transcript_5392/m.20252 type:complete len:237 (+) Transcript_5392:520-1230(+)
MVWLSEAPLMELPSAARIKSKPIAVAVAPAPHSGSLSITAHEMLASATTEPTLRATRRSNPRVSSCRSPGDARFEISLAATAASAALAIETEVSASRSLNSVSTPTPVATRLSLDPNLRFSPLNVPVFAFLVDPPSNVPGSGRGATPPTPKASADPPSRNPPSNARSADAPECTALVRVVWVSPRVAVLVPPATTSVAVSTSLSTTPIFPTGPPVVKESGAGGVPTHSVASETSKP